MLGLRHGHDGILYLSASFITPDFCVSSFSEISCDAKESTRLPRSARIPRLAVLPRREGYLGILTLWISFSASFPSPRHFSSTVLRFRLGHHGPSLSGESHFDCSTTVLFVACAVAPQTDTARTRLARRWGHLGPKCLHVSCSGLFSWLVPYLLSSSHSFLW